MFDDVPQQSKGAVPSNLPFAEPEDILGAVASESPLPESDPALDLESNPNVPLPPPPGSALDAGKLAPKPVLDTEDVFAEVPDPMHKAETLAVRPASPAANMPRSFDTPVSEAYTIAEPIASKRLMMLALFIVGVVIIGGGGLWIYMRFIADESGTALSPSGTIIAPVVPTSPAPSNQVAPIPPASSGPIVDTNILFGEPVDLDGDGLDDIDETSIGTDAKNWDSDSDGLSDGDEVLVWKTNPNNPDTDGDTFLDGAEVKNGYRPDGPGKIFEPPIQDGT